MTSSEQKVKVFGMLAKGETVCLRGGGQSVNEFSPVGAYLNSWVMAKQ